VWGRGHGRRDEEAEAEAALNPVSGRLAAAHVWRFSEFILPARIHLTMQAAAVAVFAPSQRNASR
jgi:hypothetical protein